MKRNSKKRQLNQETFTDGIRGKVLQCVSISNELDCRYISLEFEDKTELTISLDTRLTGKLELFDWKTGDKELISKTRAGSRRHPGVASSREREMKLWQREGNASI